MIRVLIADDHTLVREGVKHILQDEPGFEVVGLARTGEEAVEQARSTRPDVVLMDVQMPGMGGILAARYIRETCPGTAVIMLTMFDREEYLFEAVKEGASGYILKDLPPAQVVEAVRAAARGEALLHPGVARKLMDGFAAVTSSAQSDPAEKLSPRERDVLRLAGTGFTNRQIGSALYISERTVKKHMTQILAKLSASTRTEAVIAAVHRGLIHLEE